MKRLNTLVLVCAAVLAALVAAGTALAQVNAVDLAGTITDPQNAVVADAKVSIKNLATNATRSVLTGADGRYIIVGVAPGRYELSVEKSGFARAVTPEIIIEIGRTPEINLKLTLQVAAQQVTVLGQAEIVETQRTAVSETVGSREIENLPINGRNYVNFTLINSQANRDSAPSIGAAPTSGLNFGGQRGRSNEVSVDGADAVDNSINGIRSTVSQEDVQEFQLIISNYMPEFGRATGGVINIVTKSGSNSFHGDAFGFLRDAALQARNPFSVTVNPATGVETPTKQAYTRAQYGTAFGGPIQKDKTFYFFSFEGTRRHETGFTDIGANSGAGTGPFGLVPVPGVPFGLPAGVNLLLTPQQAAFVTDPTILGAPGGAALAGNLAVLAGSAANVAVSGVDFGAVAAAKTGGLYTPGPGAQFPLPVACAPGTMVNGRACSAIGVVSPALPASFVPLTKLIGNYPDVERTDLYAARIDHIWNANNQSFFRVNVSPSFVTGIEVNAQNQNFGENAFSRTSLQQYRDLSFVAQHNTTISSNLLNEFRFQFARRGLHYGFSDCTVAQCPTLGGLADGGQVAINLTGYAFFGREPFSTVDRIERRYQWTDHLTWVTGKHTIKFGVDTNLIQLRSKVAQIFELNFGGIFDFGSLSASSLGLPSMFVDSMGRMRAVPGATALQAYGLGLPQDFIQGTGQSNLFFDNKTFGTFIQDSWRITPRFTMNYGLRYDIEFTPEFAPFGGRNGLNAQAEKALNVVEGIPVFDTGLQPRLAIAWDPWGNGKTVIRAGGGLFFDHPLLALAFDSTTADGAQSSQLISPIGNPSACGIFPGAVVPVCGGAADGPQNLNASSIFQGVVNTTAPAGFPFSIPYLPNQQRFTALPTTPPSAFVNQNYIAAGFATPVLPFTLPTAGNFNYAYATQANLTIERDLGHNFKISVGYQYTKGTHLNRPRNINVANASLLDQNLFNAKLVGLSPANPVLVTAPAANIPATAATCGATVFVPSILAVLGGCPGPLAAFNGQFLSTAAAFNFFRPSGPNASFAGPGATLYPGLVALAQLAGYPAGYFNGATPIPTPYSDVDQQESTGNSIYHGLTINLEKRWSQHFQFLASYTYSHAIDDSTDLQTLLTPQDSNNPQLERGNSTFDQRHRFVFSGVAQSPYAWKDGGWKAVLADWTVAPIIEVASGRPFTVLTGTDYPLQFSSETSRPSIVPAGTPGGVVSPYISGVTFGLPNVCPAFPDLYVAAGISAVTSTGAGCTGNLGRNTFVRPKFATFDLRVSRKFKLTERFSFEVLADMFNLLNRFNVGDVNPLCDPAAPTGVTAGGTPTCSAGQPTAALDPRTFQFGLKLYW
jgi:hypothetical protein